LELNSNFVAIFWRLTGTQKQNMLKRKLYNDLLTWKNSHRRKPLLLQGARQVGKTFLVSEFGRKEYKEFVYLNFEQNPKLAALFDDELNPAIIIENLSLFVGKKITSDNTLIFFDEIQVAEKALKSLKYFFEKAPEFHIIAAGSLLGVSIGKNISFPVGKVNFMHMHPVSFVEYLEAAGESLILNEFDEFRTLEKFPEVIHDKLLRHLRIYMFLGGMPEVVYEYVTHENIETAREIQTEIIEAFSRDFSKYADNNLALKNTEIWNSIPWQLARENKKFQYAAVKGNARSSTHQLAIEWHKSAGLVYQVHQISKPQLPLSGYANGSVFKIYMMDVGLLGALLKIQPAIIIDPIAIFQEYNGAFTENFVASQLAMKRVGELYYWTSRSDAEVDFIIEKNNKVVPVEVKSGLSRKKHSLLSYNEKYQPEILYRLSPRNYEKQGNFINIPLYGVNFLNG
jgi:predicted AAA+ superfamily ATPase